MTEIKGWHVATAFVLSFAIIIAVNLTLAFHAVRSFPGLEVKNSYVASQAFDSDRASQLALNWDVSAALEGDTLVLRILEDGYPIAPEITSAIFGRATNVAQDQTPQFEFNGEALVAPIKAGDGNWNLRLVAKAPDGTEFKQRIIVRTR